MKSLLPVAEGECVVLTAATNYTTILQCFCLRGKKNRNWKVSTKCFIPQLWRMSELHDLKLTNKPPKKPNIHTFIMAAPVIKPERKKMFVSDVWHQINCDRSLFKFIRRHLEASAAVLFSSKWTCPLISGLHQCLCKSHIRTFPFAGSELQRSASGQKPSLLTRREAARLWASLSGVTRLKTLGLRLCSACTLWVIVSRRDWTLASHNCCTLHVPSMLFLFSSRQPVHGSAG